MSKELWTTRCLQWTVHKSIQLACEVGSDKQKIGQTNPLSSIFNHSPTLYIT